MLPYLVIFAAIIFFVIRGLGWLDDFADRQVTRKKQLSHRLGGKLRSSEEARRLEVYKQFLEGSEASPDEDEPG